MTRVDILTERQQGRNTDYKDGTQAGRRSIGLQLIFHANYLQLVVFELEDPRAVFDLVAVV